MTIETYLVTSSDSEIEHVASSFPAALGLAARLMPVDGFDDGYIKIEHIEGEGPFEFKQWFVHNLGEIDAATFGHPDEEWTE